MRENMTEQNDDRIQAESIETKTTAKEVEVMENPLGGSLNLEQMRLSGDHTGTSGYGIMKASSPMPWKNSLAMVGWQNLCKRKDLDPKDTLLKGIKPLEQNFIDYNSFKHLFGRYDAEWAISIGKYLNLMKTMAKRAGFLWEPWAAENLSFIGDRTRVKFMNLARRTDCHSFSFLGVERLEHLCRVIPFSKDSDPIGDFLRRHGITFDPTKEFDLDKFKTDVDAALNSEKLLEQGIVVDFPLVRDLTLGKVKFDKALINKVKTVKDHGGNVKSYFETLSVNKGSDSTEKNDELAMQDFNNLSNRLIQTIDQIIGNEELVDEVDTKTLLDLLAKLEALRKVTGSDLKPQVAQA
jgi:hypothetical protein